MRLLLNSVGQVRSPVVTMQIAKPGGGGGRMGAQISPGLLHVPTSSPTHVPAVVVHSGGDTGGFTTVGAQPLSITVSGAIAIEYAQGAPPQSFPAGIASAAVQAPVHAAGGSKGVGTPVQRI
jgi:hypothetical protein